MILAKASLSQNRNFIVMDTVITIVIYDRKTFMVLVSVNTIINYDRKTFIVQATGLGRCQADCKIK